MTASTAKPVRLDFDDDVRFAEAHPDDRFELVDGVIYQSAPEGDPHARTRSAIQLYLSDTLDRSKFTPYTEMSFRAPGWADGLKPDNFVARAPWLVDGRIAERPTSKDIALVIEVASTSRPKDEKRLELYGRLAIAEYWLVDLRADHVLVYVGPAAGGYERSRTYQRPETIVSTGIEGFRIPVAFLLQLATPR